MIILNHKTYKLSGNVQQFFEKYLSTTDLVIAEKNILLFLDQTINLLFISSIKIDLFLCGETFPAIFIILRRIESE